jgi:uncharacterized protein YkwD
VKALAVGFAILAALAAPLASQPARRPLLGATACLDSVESRILELVNAERRNHGLGPVQLDTALRAIARDHDDDMLARGFFSHVNPSGEGPADRIERQHRSLIGITGENIWESSGEYASQHSDLAAEIMKAWMNSPGHRENILRKEFTHLGAGVCTAGREIRATQDFASVQSFLTHPLPAAIGSGSSVDLSTYGGKAPDMFDLWSKQNRRAAGSAAPIPGARLQAPRGIYVLRFYYGRGPRSFTIYEGPTIEIR